MEALAARTGTDRRRRPRPRARADHRGHRRRLGRRPRGARRARRRAARATSSASRARWARPPPGWPSSTARATGRGVARAGPPAPRAAAGRGPRAGRRGRTRDDRPLRRAGHGRRATWPTRSGVRLDVDLDALPLAPGVAGRRGAARRARAAARRDRRRGLRAVRVPGAAGRRPRGRPGAVGGVVAGEPGAVFSRPAIPTARCTGYEHRPRLIGPDLDRGQLAEPQRREALQERLGDGGGSTSTARRATRA